MTDCNNRTAQIHLEPGAEKEHKAPSKSPARKPAKKKLTDDDDESDDEEEDDGPAKMQAVTYIAQRCVEISPQLRKKQPSCVHPSLYRVGGTWACWNESRCTRETETQYLARGTRLGPQTTEGVVATGTWRSRCCLWGARWTSGSGCW